jgi:hypothetical protein
MDLRDSPYVPGAGTRPYALVGREEIIQDFDGTLERLERGRAATAPVITGSRGSGKTVLLNELLRVAQGRQWFTAIEEVTPGASLAELTAMMARQVLFEMSARKRFADRVQRAFGVLKAFTGVKAFGIELTIDAPSVPGKADSGDLARDLRDLFVELGELGRDHSVGVVFGLDESRARRPRARQSVLCAAPSCPGQPSCCFRLVWPFPVVAKRLGRFPRTIPDPFVLRLQDVRAVLRTARASIR